jgi:hypothetical protein
MELLPATNAVWHAGTRCAGQADVNNLAQHDFRRTRPRLCHGCGGELEQIQFLLGHASVQTTEKYIGNKSKLQVALNDRAVLQSRRDEGLVHRMRRIPPIQPYGPSVFPEYAVNSVRVHVAPGSPLFPVVAQRSEQPPIGSSAWPAASRFAFNHSAMLG